MRRERVKVSERRTLARERGIRAEARGGKGGFCSEGRQIPRSRGRARNESLLNRSRRKHERVCGREVLQDNLQSPNFIPSLAKPEIGKEVVRRRARS